MIKSDFSLEFSCLDSRTWLWNSVLVARWAKVAPSLRIGRCNGREMVYRFVSAVVSKVKQSAGNRKFENLIAFRMFWIHIRQ